jgi:isopenicillin-N N-acyltransferase-like protein
LKTLRPIVLEGEAYDRGRMYGACCADDIRRNLAGYLRLIRFHSGLKPARALEASRATAPAIEEYAPELLQEIRGIADGSGVELEEALLINARSELMSGGECTALAVAPGRTVDGDVLLAQNWDWFSAVEPEPVLLRIRQPGLPEILTVAEAGQVGKVGLNSAGLGVALNFLEHRDRGEGVPIHIILRRMLSCAHLGDAIHAALSVPRGCSANLLLAHAAGELLDLELTPRDADFLYGEGDRLVHANHFESQRLRAGDSGLAESKSTLARAARARRLLAASGATVSPDGIKAILADHTHGPYAICRHAEPSVHELDRTETRASIVMELSARKLHLSVGQPCNAGYSTYSLGDV